ncbi:hypothetical protein BJ508DRAFT_361534 [Ascobolus immersus RN42]|uniref:Nucleolar protein 16 n=1 Tax=Ascobolus immersus RN42 TaxID=1160509 RepID=A0A3N4I760_ASCIM|nr:hypothetical protein BJ508DRAFT_361534 [Ascobolus immersus RN42]
MARPLQRKKQRSSKPKVKFNHNPRFKKVSIVGSETVKNAWDKELTLAQNYKKLGLRSRLNPRTGGIEKTLSKTVRQSSPAPAPKPVKVKLAPGEARIVRDPETNAILRIEYGKSAEDQLDGEDDEEMNEVEEEKEEVTDVVKKLEEEASWGVKRERLQSEREEDWIARLVNKYGDDYVKMSRDMKLNPFQQTPGDLRKRVTKWKKLKAKAEGAEN